MGVDTAEALTVLSDTNFTRMCSSFSYFAPRFAANGWWRYGRVAEEVAGV
jgi:hypothetical protein